MYEVKLWFDKGVCLTFYQEAKTRIKAIVSVINRSSLSSIMDQHGAILRAKSVKK